MFNRWFVVLGAIMVQICLGAVYAWSLFNQPLADEFGWDREDIVVTFSITIAVFAFSTIFAGKLQDRIGPRWVATIGGVFLGIGLILASRATTITQLYFFYGVIGGIGIGTAYVCPLAASVKWFPDKKGLISGMAVAGFGAGGLVFKPLIIYFIESFGVSNTFLYLGMIYFFLVVGGAQLLINPPQGYNEQFHSSTVRDQQQFSPKKMVSTYQFYLLWPMFLFGTMAGLMIIGFAVDIGVQLANLTIESAGNAVMVIAIFNAAGRILWGLFSDKLGRKNTLLIMYTITVFVLLYMTYGSMNYFTFLLSVSIIGFCFGGFLSVYPSLTADYYGTNNLGINYGIMYQAYGLAAFFGPFIARTLPFTQAFLLSAIFSVIGIILGFFVTLPKYKEKLLPQWNE
ncbi:OFA family MFS transporter [Anaerobacillus sp. MEB173]|uniref:L-lactate MFS transporter n=1 Tax=Anaerobacillus sp. MEB173 TaxID=3383345 RepID=UPI003F91C717